MDEKSEGIIKPNDIELSHLDHPYEKPGDVQKNNQILVPEEPTNNKSPTRVRPFSPIPKKIVIMSLLLFIIGISFLISGLVDYFQGDRERGIAFIVFGSLMFIPGIFYTYQIYLACVAGSPEERQEILDDIPNIDF
jgi:hypothetical protein